MDREKGELTVKICVFGGDLRNLRLAEELAAAGYPNDAYAVGPGAADPAVLSAYDVVVGPVPLSRDGTNLHAPLAEKKIPVAAFLGFLKKGATLFAGTLPAGSSAEGFRYIDLTKDAALYEKNLVPTCEGIVQILLGRIDFTLHGSRLLLLGYGRLARRLAPLLRALGTEVFLYSAVGAEGDAFYPDFRSGDLADLSSYDLVVNTVPAPLLGRKELSTAKKGVFVLDVASAPGGVDTQAAAGLGIDLLAAGGIPGAKAPRSVARAMLDAVIPNLPR